MSALEDAAFALVAVMENGIYFGYGPDERDRQGERRIARAKERQRLLELEALAALRQALKL
jgi:hypothetical protein